MYNLFRIAGDVMHLASVVILLLKIHSQKNCKGISLKTQVLYLVVFLTRYIDLLYNFASLYNSLMKIFFIATAGAIVYLMRFKKPYCDSYDSKADSFSMPLLIVPCAILSLVINEYFSLVEILWTFSIYLEAVAIIPQLMVVHAFAKAQSGFVDNLSSHYVFCLGGYRVMYLINWIWRAATEEGYRNWIVWLSGAVQSLIYCDFFYYYVIAAISGKSLALPI